MGRATEAIKVTGPITAPLLAGKVTDTSKLNYPVLASRKLDGIRCIMTPEGALTRS
jgi:hypothetical protein